MINWDDPDYKSAGHFYALVQSVTVTCSDISAAPSNATSYIYGSNATTLTPSVAFSNKSTVNSAMGGMTAIASPWAMWSVASAVVFSLLGAALA